MKSNELIGGILFTALLVSGAGIAGTIEQADESPTPAVIIEAAEPSSEGCGRFDVPRGEILDLAALVELEAGGESTDCQKAVCSAVYNRWKSGTWGETLSEVIYSPGQFEPADKIGTFEPRAETVELVREILLNGSAIPEDVMFFRIGHYHRWEGARDEFEIDGVYFSSSEWLK